MPTRTIHESLKIDGPVGSFAALVPHYSYQSWDDRRKRLKAYSKLWAQNEFERGRKVGILSPIFRAVWKFFRGAILEGGILDGWLGVQIALSNTSEVYRKYQALRSTPTRPETSPLESSDLSRS